MLIGQSPLMLLFKVAIYDLKVKVSRGKYTVQKYKKKKSPKRIHMQLYFLMQV